MKPAFIWIFLRDWKILVQLIASGEKNFEELLQNICSQTVLY